MNKNALIVGLMLNGIGVTLDLLTTWIGLNGYGLYETRIFGNNPFIAYPVFLGLVAMFFGLIRWLQSKIHEKSRSFNYASVTIYAVIVLLPYIAVTSNIIVLNSL